MLSKQLIFAASALAAFAVVFAEPPVSSYGPPGYTAPRVISSGPSSILSSPGATSISSGTRINTISSGINSGLGSGIRVGSSGISTNFVGLEGGEPEPFNYAYEVKDQPSGNDFGAVANSDGKRVQGEYRVLLPDGRRQVVKYTADDGGYNADVQYEGQARYPAPVPYNGPLAVPSTGTINTGSTIVAPSFTKTITPTVTRTITPIVAAPSPSSLGSSVTPGFSGYRY